METTMMEHIALNNEAVMMLNNLDSWSKPRSCEKDLAMLFDTLEIRPQPYGVALVIGPWNYPVQLTLMPAIGAIAAGNCVVVKPSEVSAATAQLLEEIIPQYLDNDCIRVVNGGVQETTALLKERFDYIFYTGNSTVGKIVYQAAAKYLTPVTLELGGKSPCYVADDSDLAVVARRVAWGRFLNCGQTCIAPDYVLCQPVVQEKLVQQLGKVLKEFYGSNALQSDNYGFIVNDKHFQRLKGLLSSGRVAIGGQFEEDKKLLAPTVLVDVKPTDPAMQEEIFGPILPIMTVADEDEAIAFINTREKSLSLYAFTKNKAVAAKIISRTSSGGVTINDTLMHASAPGLPFGGVGNSGMGGYHGKYTFETFSHMRGCMLRKQNMEMLNDVRYPPYSQKKIDMIKFALGKRDNPYWGLGGFMFSLVLMGSIVGALIQKFRLES